MKRFIYLLLFVVLIGLFFTLLYVNYGLIEANQLTTNSSALINLLNGQKLGPPIFNPLKYAIRGVLDAGVPGSTVVLLLLLPVVAAFIAGARHIIGLKSFGIFLPAALAVVFLALRPTVGIGLFLLIVGVSTLVRMILRKSHLKLQYLPRMAFILWAVVIAVLGVLFLTPHVSSYNLSNITIFPVFIIILLTEDFTRVQLGKSVKTAINLTTETLILGLCSYLILSFRPLQEFAIIHPESLMIAVAVVDVLLGKYIGLRFLEFWRFRKLINS